MKYKLENCNYTNNVIKFARYSYKVVQTVGEMQDNRGNQVLNFSGEKHTIINKPKISYKSATIIILK